MLGPTKVRDLDRLVLVSLEHTVPPDHFYRHLESTLDLAIVRDWVADLYAVNGRPSVDPIVFFKLQLIMFFEGIRSERKLVEIASLNLAHRWYLGYNLDEPLPNHSSLTRIRQRLGLAVFRRFFEHVLDLCEEAHLIWGREVLVDATKVPGNAAVDSLVPRLKVVVDDYLVELFGEEDLDEVTPPSDDEPEPPLLHPEVADDSGLLVASAQRLDVIETCRLSPDRPLSPGYERLSHRKISRTDPDAASMAMRDGRTVLGYQTHYLVDGGRSRIILHCLVMPGDVMENQPFLDQFFRTRFARKLHPRRVIGDTAYGTTENIRAIEDQGIQMLTPLPEWEKSSPYFLTSDFTYDHERDVYVCPKGTLLVAGWVDLKAERVQYHAPAAACRECPVRAQCTSLKRGRLIYRSFHAEYLERVKAYHGTPAFEKAMRKRRVWVEPLFAEAKQWHGLSKFRLRRLPNVNIEGVVIATGQNLKRWLVAQGWGRRLFPSALWGARAENRLASATHIPEQTVASASLPRHGSRQRFADPDLFQQAGSYLRRWQRDVWGHRFVWDG